MTEKDDRFDALAGLEDDDEELEEPEESDPEPMQESTSDPTPSRDESPSGSIDDPAFSYAESNQGPIYARPETWDAYDDTLELDVEMYLREEGIRNAQKRELHDAALRLATKHPDELAELLIEARKD